MTRLKKHEAETLVNATFTHNYDEQRFRQFTDNLFHDYTSLKEKASAGQYIPEAFRDKIISYKRLAKFEDPEGMEIDVLAVKLASRYTLENARTMQRNFIARYLNGSRGGNMKDAALVAFYTDDCEDWRFSLVRMDYVLDEEKQKIRKELTPARRYSFLVGGNENTHTARSQLLPVLQSDVETTLADLEKAFNIETVTKEFFERYKGLYLKLVDALEVHLKADSVTKSDFEAKGVVVADFSKRLLGQIVFLYFLQKKGWLGVAKGADWGAGPKDFLQALYRTEYGKYDNFFNDMLEPLFYEALATERTDNFYKRFNCRIPFLNGGLFEPLQGYDWVNTDILLDNKIFAEIFKVFDLYNFTVREDEPLDREVAVDPEMLGKVFENLIPENERKGSGTFYTPREIVHYMCQESLINFLDSKLNIESRPIETDEQPSLIPDLAKTDLLTKYEDVYAPIVPRDDLAEFIYHGDVAQEHDTTAEVKTRNENYKGDYQHRIPKSIRDHAETIDEALAHVKICDPAIGSGAFPVGIMNEIVRSRQALNAYLGSENRTPYYFKRNAIQESIYGVDIEPSAVDIAKLRLWLSLVVDEEDFGNIKPLPNLDYKIVVGNSLLGFPFNTEGRTQKLRTITPLKEEFINASSPSKKAELRGKINAIIESEYNAQGTERSICYKVNFDFRWSFFEVFDDNGGFDIVIANPPYVDSETMVKADKKYRDTLKNKYASADGNWDLFVVFVELGIIILNRFGSLQYITPNKIIGAVYATSIRKIMSKQNICEIRDYSSIDVFEEADVYPVVIGLTKAPVSREIKLTTMKNITTPRLSISLESKVFRKDNLWDKYFGEPKHVNILCKLQEMPVLEKYVDKILGAATVSEAYKIKKILFEKPEPSNNDFKLINTGTIDPYVNFWGISNTQYIKARYRNPCVNLRDLQSMNEQRALQSETSKIIIAGMSKRLECFLDKEGEFLAGKSTSIIIDKNQNYLEALCVVLNSKLLSYWLNMNFKSLKMAGGYINIGVAVLKSVPIIQLDNSSEKKLKTMHAEITKALLNDDRRRVVKLNKKIDQLVYKLYDLTPEEITIIEDSTQ